MVGPDCVRVCTAFRLADQCAYSGWQTGAQFHRPTQRVLIAPNQTIRRRGNTTSAGSEPPWCVAAGTERFELLLRVALVRIVVDTDPTCDTDTDADADAAAEEERARQQEVGG